MALQRSQPVLLQQLQILDTRAFYWVLLRRRVYPQLANLSRHISKSADGFLYPLIAFVLAVSGVPFGREAALAFAIGFALERSLYQLLKKGFRRNRPMDKLPGIRSVVIPGDQFSFPSGHTSGAFLAATIVCSAMPWLAPLMFAWATLIGFSRVCLGVHFPLDTVAGAALGVTCANLALGLIV